MMSVSKWGVIVSKLRVNRWHQQYIYVTETARTVYGLRHECQSDTVEELFIFNEGTLIRIDVIVGCFNFLDMCQGLDTYLVMTYTNMTLVVSTVQTAMFQSPNYLITGQVRNRMFIVSDSEHIKVSLDPTLDSPCYC